MAEACAAVSHIEREADALRQHLVHTLYHILRRARLVAGTPLVEPAAPELRAHLWGVGPQLAEATELLVDVRTRAEVHRPRQVIEAVLLEVARPVALEQRQLRAVDAAQAIPYLTDVGLVLAIASVFVLHLDHDDRTSVLNGQRLQLLAHLLLEYLHTLHEVRVAFAQANVLLLQQPPGQTAHLPLGTDIGSRAHDDVHPVLLCQTAELRHVVVTREVELTLLLLMDVPEHVEAQRVHAQRLAHLNAMLPVGARNTRVVHFGSLHHKGLSVQKECLVAHGKRAGLLCSLSQCGNSQQPCSQRNDGKEFFQFHLIIGLDFLQRYE